MADLIRLRDLPGVGPLEWAIAEHGWTDTNEERATDLSDDLFGIDPDDTHPWLDDDGQTIIGGVETSAASPEELASQCQAWEQHFEVLRYFRDEADAFWTSVGWDITNGEGKQLEVMRLLGRPLVCVVKKIHVDASLNLEEEDDLDAWTAKLEQEAKLFKPRR